MLKKSSNNSASNKPLDSVDTLIGVNTQIQGDLEFSGGIRVDGKLTGNIKSVDANNSTLVLSESAHIEGNITVAHVIINGRVNGNIIASERVILQPKAVIKGDVRYRSVEMALGASVNGALVCEEAGPKKVNAPQTSKSMAGTPKG